MVRSERDVLVVLMVVALACLVGQCHSQLQFDFYKGKCVNKTTTTTTTSGSSFSDLFNFFRPPKPQPQPKTVVTDVEPFVASLVADAISKGRIDVAALLRLHFHDCFVNGCDASILLESDGSGSESEKKAGANGSVRGYEFINEVKKALEKACFGTVSCADIITLVTRDAVEFSTKKSITYKVKTGRRDGLRSRNSDVNLPSPSMTVKQSIAAFKAKNLDEKEMVYLLGAHTVGKTHCGFTKSRFTKTEQPMNATLAKDLQRQCSAGGDTVEVALDQGTPNTVDKAFFDQLMISKGVLDLDQALIYDAATKSTVTGLSQGSIDFNIKFAEAMKKLGEIEVLTELQGEVRTSCDRRRNFP